jgi:hypothetical protein
MSTSYPSQHPNASNAAEHFSQICTLLLQSQQNNCVQDAATFSRLLCVNKQLQHSLLYAAVGCIKAGVPRCFSGAKTDISMVHWLVQHVGLGTIRHIEIEADDFHPDLYILLSEQLQKLPLHAATAAAKPSASPRAHQLLQAYCAKTEQQQQQQQSSQQQPSLNSCHSASMSEPAANADQCHASVAASSSAHVGMPHCAACHISSSSSSSRGALRRLPSIFVSWHVCGECVHTATAIVPIQVLPARLASRLPDAYSAETGCCVYCMVCTAQREFWGTLIKLGLYL